jgi:cellulose synthase/poly-beta-1,6-N-acetylglucosamine synthase-like glycosyltransferase
MVLWAVRSRPGPWTGLGAFVVAVVVVLHPRRHWRDALTAILAMSVAVASLDYLAWRVHVVNWGAWWVSVPLLAAEIGAAVHIVGMQYTVWPRRELPLRVVESPEHLPIFVFVPTVDEGVAVVRETLAGVLSARARYHQSYPDTAVEVVVCNDGGVAGAPCSKAIKHLAARLGVRCITRSVGGGAKAGNLEHARREVGATGDSLIVIFDADQVPVPDFLLRVVVPFADPSVGWVQTGQYYRNVDNPVARWANDQQGLFYRAICPGKARQNAAFICGTNVMIRASALDEIGGLPTDSLTEDFAASIELHPTWLSVFLPDELAHGLGPVDLTSYLKQQRRWARGTFGVLRSKWREIALPRRERSLTVPQRIQYMLASTHYLCGARDLVYLIAPLVFLFGAAPAVRGATLGTFLWHFLPYFILGQAAFWHTAYKRSGLRGVILGFGSAPVLAAAAWTTLVLGRTGTFTVTPKRRAGRSSLRWVIPHLIAVAVCIVAFPFAIVERSGPAVAVSLAWVGYEVVLIGAFLGLAAVDAGFKVPVPRLPRVPLPAMSRVRGRHWIAAAGGALLVVLALVAVPQRRRPAAVFTPVSTPRPEPGIFLPTGDPTPVTSVERSLRLHARVEGRAEEIRSHFDSKWARAVDRGGAIPWVVLQFTTNGHATIWSSLPAIENGSQDGALRRWGRELASFGRPVFLTVLPDDDRNWAASSGVANGGIPQDSRRAWAHVEDVIRDEGATNVAWVWSPANPGQDQPYSPPDSQISATLVTLLEYQGTHWADPAAAIASAQRRHPHVPLMVEVALENGQGLAAAWLGRLQQALTRDHHVLTVIYHEGGPVLRPTAAQRHAWSVTADPVKESAFRALFESPTALPQRS